MNYSKMLDDQEGLKTNLKQILKDVNKRLTKAEEGAGEGGSEGGSAESEALIAELQAQITALTPPKTRVSQSSYIELTDTTYGELSVSITGDNHKYLNGGGMYVNFDGSHMISGIIGTSDYTNTILNSISCANLKINDVELPIVNVSKASQRDTYYPSYVISFNTTTSQTDDGYISNVPLVAEGNIISLDLTNAQTNTTITIIGTFDIAGTTVGSITTTVLSDESE